MEKRMTLIQAVRLAMQEEMRRDENVILIGEDVGGFGGAFQCSQGLQAEFGEERVIDTPISEQGIAITATGAAMAGMRPIVDMMYADFSAFMYDGIANEAAKMYFNTDGQVSVPIVFRSSQGAAGGGSGMHHSQCVESWFMNLPGLKIVSPSTPADAKGLLKSAIRDNNPVLFLEHKKMYADRAPVPVEDDFLLPLGKAKIVREGTDVTVIASQVMLKYAEQAAAEAAEKGISVELIDPMTIKPFDREAFAKSVTKTGRAILIHESPVTGGYAAEYAACLQEDCFASLKKPIRRVCGLDAPLPAGAMDLYMLPTKEDILKAICEIVE